METRISATGAARRFSDLLNRVLYKGEQFVVERNGQPVCRIVPANRKKFTVADLVKLLESAPKPDEGYWEILEEIKKNQPPLRKSPWER